MKSGSLLAVGLLRDLVATHTGLYFSDQRLDSLIERLTPLMVQRGMTTWLDYYYFLRYEAEAADEWPQVQSALAVSETYFWRELAHFEAISDQLMARLSERPLRIWHAGCASGEEPYTHVMHLMERGQIDQVELMASDADRLALERARRGIYGPRSFRKFPPALQERYFRQIDERQWEIKPFVRSRVKFSEVNLANTPLRPPERGELANLVLEDRFDIIMCRNVFIYFQTETQERVAREFYRALRSPGFVFVGVSESLLRLDVPFELIQVGDAFCYEKKKR